MAQKFNQFLDAVSEFLAQRKGLLVMLGMLLIAVNAVLQFFPDVGWLVRTNLFLHLGILLAFVGVLLAWAL